MTDISISIKVGSSAEGISLENLLTDSNGTILLDSNSVQLIDSS